MLRHCQAAGTAAYAVAIPVVRVFHGEDGGVRHILQPAAAAQVRRGAQRDPRRRIERAIAGLLDARIAAAVLHIDGDHAFGRNAGQRHGLQPVAIGRIARAVGADQREHEAEALGVALRIERGGTAPGAAGMAGGAGARIEQRAEPVIGAGRARRRHPGALEQRLADGAVEAGIVGCGGGEEAGSDRVRSARPNPLPARRGRRAAPGEGDGTRRRAVPPHPSPLPAAGEGEARRPDDPPPSHHPEPAHHAGLHVLQYMAMEHPVAAGRDEGDIDGLVGLHQHGVGEVLRQAAGGGIDHREGMAVQMHRMRIARAVLDGDAVALALAELRQRRRHDCACRRSARIPG